MPGLVIPCLVKRLLLLSATWAPVYIWAMEEGMSGIKWTSVVFHYIVHVDGFAPWRAALKINEITSSIRVKASLKGRT